MSEAESDESGELQVLRSAVTYKGPGPQKRKRELWFYDDDCLFPDYPVPDSIRRYWPTVYDLEASENFDLLVQKDRDVAPRNCNYDASRARRLKTIRDFGESQRRKRIEAAESQKQDTTKKEEKKKKKKTERERDSSPEMITMQFGLRSKATNISDDDTSEDHFNPNSILNQREERMTFEPLRRKKIANDDDLYHETSRESNEEQSIRQQSSSSSSQLTRKKQTPRVLSSLDEDSDANSESEELRKLKNSRKSKVKEESEKKSKLKNLDAAIKENKKGLIANNNKDWDAALKHYNKAIEFDPTISTIYSNISVVYFVQEKYEKCIELCEKAIEIERKNRDDSKIIAKILMRIGHTYKKMLNWKRAKMYYERSMSLDNNSEINLLLKDIERKIKKNIRILSVECVSIVSPLLGYKPKNIKNKEEAQNDSVQKSILRNSRPDDEERATLKKKLTFSDTERTSSKRFKRI